MKNSPFSDSPIRGDAKKWSKQKSGIIIRTPPNKSQKCQVQAVWGVKRPRDHLPVYKLDLPDPIFGVPELNKWNLTPKIKTNDYLGPPEIRLKFAYYF